MSRIRKHILNIEVFLFFCCFFIYSAESDIKNYETLNMTVQNGSGSDAMVEINGVVYPVDIRADLGTLPDKLQCSDRQNGKPSAVI